MGFYFATVPWKLSFCCAKLLLQFLHSVSFSSFILEYLNYKVESQQSLNKEKVFKSILAFTCSNLFISFPYWFFGKCGVWFELFLVTESLIVFLVYVPTARCQWQNQLSANAASDAQGKTPFGVAFGVTDINLSLTCFSFAMNWSC